METNEKRERYPEGASERSPLASWLAPGEGCCFDCGYPVVVTQPLTNEGDYSWYCSNPRCKRHEVKETHADTHWPEWVIKKEQPPLCECGHSLKGHCGDGSCMQCEELGIHNKVCAPRT